MDYRMRSLAVEILREEMQHSPIGKSEFVDGRYSESADSGMEDGATSPASSISSGSSEMRSLSVFSPDLSGSDGNLSVPRQPFIEPSEGSAFSKIDRKIIPQFPFPNLAPVSPFCPPFGMGYFPGMCLSSYNLDSLHGGTPVPAPRGFPENYLSASNPRNKEENEETRSSPDLADKNAYYYVDTKIPFTNYFMNLTKIFHRDSGKKVSEKNENVKEDYVKMENEKEISVEKETNAETMYQINNGMEVKSFFNNRLENDMKQNSVPENLTISPQMYSTGPFPLPSPILSTLPSPSLLQFMNTVNAPPSMFHPAFLQIPGVGMKRLASDKPPPVKKYKCDVCGKAFSRSNTLVTHKHSRSQFYSASSLKPHTTDIQDIPLDHIILTPSQPVKPRLFRIHTGDKPFKCESCGRAFRQPGNLTRHRLTHTTVKPYVCPHCNKAFNRASNLNTHMRTHTNYKPFMCPYCGKGFHQKIDMKIHCYTHTSRLPTQQI